MKKLFIFINSLILLISCDQLPGETSNILPQKIDIININLPTKSIKIKVFNVIYKEHEYLFFRGNTATTACIHNPDCKYCKNK